MSIYVPLLGQLCLTHFLIKCVVNVSPVHQDVIVTWPVGWDVVNDDANKKDLVFLVAMQSV
jgi:hypothetical protein